MVITLTAGIAVRGHLSVNERTILLLIVTRLFYMFFFSLFSSSLGLDNRKKKGIGTNLTQMTLS